MGSMQQQQRRVALGMGGAAVFSALFLYLGFTFWPIAAPQTATASARLALALRCDVFVALMLLLGIGNVARQRFFSPSAIDGSTPATESSIAINVRYVQNTLEQVVLAVVAHLALALLVPAAALAMIPLLVTLFVIARLCFWIGYHVSPTSRAFGFAATFYPTIGVYAYVIWHLLT